MEEAVGHTQQEQSMLVVVIEHEPNKEARACFKKAVQIGIVIATHFIPS